MKNTKISKKLGLSVLIVGLLVGTVSVYGIQAEGQDNKSLLQETANNTESESSTNSTLNPEDVENSDDANVTIIPENEDADSIDESSELSERDDFELIDGFDNVVPNTFVIKDIFTDPYIAEIIAMELSKDGVEDTVSQDELDSITTFIYDGSVEDPFRPAMKSIDGLQYLRNLDTITIKYSDITNVDALSEFDSLAYLDLIGNHKLTNIEGLYGLNSAGHVEISNNSSLQSTEGLRNLHQVHGSIFITNNPSLITLGLVNLETIGDDLYITNNNALERIDGLESLVSVIGSIIIEDNDSITEFTSAQRLELGGFVVFSVMNNKNLETISFNPDYLTSLPIVEIKDNQSLRSVTGLSGLNNLTALTISNTKVNYVEVDVISKNPAHTLQFNEIDLRNNAILDLSQFNRIDGSRTMTVDATGQVETLVVPYVNGKFVMDNPLKDIEGNPIKPTVKNGTYDATSNTITFNPKDGQTEFGFDWSVSTGISALYENYKFSGKVTVLLEDTTIVNSKDLTLQTTDSWNTGDAFVSATVIANNEITNYTTYDEFVAAGGSVTTNVPTPLVAGVYDAEYTLNGVTSHSIITVVDAPIVVNNYSINASDFTVSLDDARKMTSQDIISRSHAIGMNTTLNTPAAVDTKSSSFDKVGVYPVTLFVSEHESTTTTINVTVVDSKVDDKKDDKKTPATKAEQNRGSLPKTGIATSYKAISVGVLLTIGGALLIVKKKFND